MQDNQLLKRFLIAVLRALNEFELCIFVDRSRQEYRHRKYKKVCKKFLFLVF